MLIDSHCHLHDKEFFTPDQQEEFLDNAHASGVERIICIGTDPEDSMAAKAFAEAHDGVYWTYGIHPEECKKYGRVAHALDSATVRTATREEEAALARNDGPRERRVAESNAATGPGHKSCLVAIGEVGLDYHSDGYDRSAQIDLLNNMLSLATDLDLPVSFHVRSAFPDFFGVISNFPHIRGVLHSFTDSKKTLRKLLETTDFYIGVNGLATYSTLPMPPLDRILLETDAPFLTPAPFRGIINQPAYIRNIADWLSTTSGVPLSEVERITTDNVTRLFHLPDTVDVSEAL